MFEFDWNYVLRSDTAHMLIVFSVFVVAFIVWSKRRAMKFSERRTYFKRLKAAGLRQADEQPKQLEFDF